MSLSMRVYALGLGAIVCVWFAWNAQALMQLTESSQLAQLAGIAAVYLCSHVFRMFRLALLTLDERNKIPSLLLAHGLTALPSSFAPLKLGEILRLGAFLHVYHHRRKAIAVWLAERFGDILVITCFILMLHLFRMEVPARMRVIFIVFAVCSVVGLLALLSFTKILLYLNRNLVLTSHSRRGLVVLRMSHALRTLENDIRRSLEGRALAFLLLSAAIWAMEIVALSMFIHRLTTGTPDFRDLFVSGLIASIGGASASGALAFGFYQSLVLVLLSIMSLGMLLLRHWLNRGASA